MAKAKSKEVAVVSKEFIKTYEDGKATAATLWEMFGKATMKAVELYVHVAEFGEKAEAQAFVQGFAEKAEFLRSNGNADERRAGDRVYELVSKMRRVIKAVHGIEQKKDGKTKVLRGWGSERVIAHLTGKGDVKAKMERLPFSQDTSRRKNKDGGTNDPIQKRIDLSKNSVASHEVLGATLGIPQAIMGKKGVTQSKLPVTILTAAIRVVPDGNLGELVNATVNRMLASSDDTMRDLGVSFRDALMHSGVAKQVKAVTKPKRTLVKREAAKVQPKGEVAEK